MTTTRVACWAIQLAAVLTTAPSARAVEPAPRSAEPETRRVVLEDDAVRIEELRVRGQVLKISVTPKAAGARPYEILPPDASRDASQNRGLAGQRVWNLFSF